MLYQHFAIPDNAKRKELSGLVMRRMPAIIIGTIIYFAVAVLDAAINSPVMAVIFLVINIAYVFCFFKQFSKKRKK